MTDEERQNALNIGVNAALIYKGAMKELKNSNKAEKIIFLFFSAMFHGRQDDLQLFLDNFLN